jgi:hypothetical protein
MAATTPSEHDDQNIAQRDDPTRQARIARLLLELAAIRPARRRDDETRRRRIEAELILLLNAEIIKWRLARETASAAAAPPNPIQLELMH